MGVEEEKVIFLDISFYRSKAKIFLLRKGVAFKIGSFSEWVGIRISRGLFRVVLEWRGGENLES